MNPVHGHPSWNTPARATSPAAVDSRLLDPAPVPATFHTPHARRPVRARRPSAAATARVRATGGLRPRRRLRREIRLAGSVALMVAPLALAAALLLNAPSTGVRGADGEAPKGVAVVRPPTVWLSTVSPDGAPVVLPGYLLPDDGLGTEEPAHAGG